jgi:hypothetical protein
MVLSTSAFDTLTRASPSARVVAPHTYRKDTHRRAPKQEFLGKGSVPPGLDEDFPTDTAMVTTAATELDQTCEILDR